ncbi:MAG: pantoate--beta-alanine ligase [Bacillota bacterium]
MKVYQTIDGIKGFIAGQDDKSIGFVPTMGYLHEGHLALMKQAKKENDVVIVSIFVNPTQFGPGEDYDQYPRDIDRDAELAASVGVDAVFNPDSSEIYTPNFSTTVEVSGITDKLCGARRPGHFSGVCTIVTKLFNIITPRRAYFGQKDAQQVAVIKKMVRELNFDIVIKTVPIVREEDGLAVSSRNKYLDQEQREAATVLYEALQLAKKMVRNDGCREGKAIREQTIEFIEQEPLADIDYVEVVNQNDLEQAEVIEGKVLIAVAVYIGETRLIDNLMMEVN